LDLALFDFDGTITTQGTYPAFIRFAIRPRRKFFASIILGPLIVGYRVGLVSDRAIRRAMSRVVFQGEQPDRLRRLGERYAAEALPDLMRPPALERIAWHKARGDRVVGVSASLDVHLDEMLDMADKKFFRWQEVARLPEARPATRRGDGGI
jgi:phosphatidylglycerophosphatase C